MTPVINERGDTALSHIYVLDDKEKVLCQLTRPFGCVLRDLRSGLDVKGEMLKEFAEDFKKVDGVDLLDTFKEIREDELMKMKSNRMLQKEILEFFESSKELSVRISDLKRAGFDINDEFLYIMRWLNKKGFVLRQDLAPGIGCDNNISSFDISLKHTFILASFNTTCLGFF